MSLPAALVLAGFLFSGVAVLSYGVGRLVVLVRFRRNSVRLLARQMPDHMKPALRGFAEINPAIYQRRAQFFCPLSKELRVITEAVASSRQSHWSEGQKIAVQVSTIPPYTACIATFRNLYAFPIIYILIGIFAAVVLPLGVLNA